MRVFGVLAMVTGLALAVGRCMVGYKWLLLAVLLLVPLVITWSVEVFTLNGLGIFSWFLLARRLGGTARHIHMWALFAFCPCVAASTVAHVKALYSPAMYEGLFAFHGPTKEARQPFPYAPSP